MASYYGDAPSTTPIQPFPGDVLQYKSKRGARLELPGLYYSQYVPTAANLTSGTVTNSGASMIGALQLGGTTANTLPWGGTAAVTFTSSSGLLVNFTTSSFLPTTLNYNDFPVSFSLSHGFLATDRRHCIGSTGSLAATTLRPSRS